MSNVGANVARCETVFLVSDSIGGTVRSCLCPNHNTFKQPSANPVSHDTCTRELPPAFVTRATEKAKNEQHRSQRSTLRNSLPGIGFRWGHCQVLFVSQHNTFKQPSANPVSHDTCTRELPPTFVTRATASRRKMSNVGANVARCETVFLVSDSIGGTVRSCLCPNTTLSSNHRRIQSLTTLAHANCRQRL